MPETSHDFRSITEVAERYRVNPATIRRMIDDGKLPTYRIGDRAIRIDVNEADRLLRQE